MHWPVQLLSCSVSDGQVVDALPRAVALVIGTDRERHQISALLIFQLLGRRTSVARRRSRQSIRLFSVGGDDRRTSAAL